MSLEIACPTLRSSLLLVLVHALGTILNNVQLDTIALWQGNPRLASLPNHEDIVQPCGESVSSTILKVNNFEGAWVTLTVHNDANTSNTVSRCYHAMLPTSNLMWSRALPEAKSYRIVSCTLASGSGNLIVRPSCVMAYGTPFCPCLIALTLQSL